MKLSISTFPYVNYSLDEAIRRIADLGYDGVEIWGGRPHAYCYDIDNEEATRIRKLVEKLGLEVSVLAARAPDVWRTQRGLELFGPKHFGFDYTYVPVERNLTG